MAKTQVAVAERAPLEVKIIAPEPKKSPHHGKFPYWNEKVPTRKVKFSYLQQVRLGPSGAGFFSGLHPSSSRK